MCGGGCVCVVVCTGWWGGGRGPGGLLCAVVWVGAAAAGAAEIFSFGCFLFFVLSFGNKIPTSKLNFNFTRRSKISKIGSSSRLESSSFLPVLNKKNTT
jgi:hypothetical protein